MENDRRSVTNHELLPSSNTVGVPKEFVNVVEHDEHRLYGRVVSPGGEEPTLVAYPFGKALNREARALRDELRAEVARTVTGLVSEPSEDLAVATSDIRSRRDVPMEK